MKRKIIIPIVGAVVLVGAFSVTTLFANQSNKEVSETQYLNSKKKDAETKKKEKRLDNLKKQKEELETDQGNTKEDLDKYKEVVAEIDEQEQELGMTDYKEEFETRLNTYTAVVQDTQRELGRGVPAELEEKAKARVERLGKVVEKYEKKSKDKTLDEYDYQQLYEEMGEEANNIKLSLDKEFPTE